MVSESARTLELLRERDRQKRTLQVWIGLVVVWGVVVGWVAYFAVRSFSTSMGSLLAWLTYFVPLAVFAIIAFLHWHRLRTIDAELLTSTQADLKRG